MRTINVIVKRSVPESESDCFKIRCTECLFNDGSCPDFAEV